VPTENAGAAFERSSSRRTVAEDIDFLAQKTNCDRRAGNVGTQQTHELMNGVLVEDVTCANGRAIIALAAGSCAVGAKRQRPQVARAGEEMREAAAEAGSSGEQRDGQPRTISSGRTRRHLALYRVVYDSYLLSSE
jgi:hypothetical protein